MDIDPERSPGTAAEGDFETRRSLGETNPLDNGRIAIESLRVGIPLSEGIRVFLTRAARVIAFPPEGCAGYDQYLETMRELTPAVKGENNAQAIERIKVAAAEVVDGLGLLANGEKLDPDQLSNLGTFMQQAFKLSASGHSFGATARRDGIS